METPGSDAVARRRAFMELAGQMYDGMFGPDEQLQLITFTQREERALEQGEKLQTALLQEHLQGDPLAQPSAPHKVRCPDCQQLGQLRQTQERLLRARTGATRWSRAMYYCKRCRRSFSPSGHRAGLEPRRL